MDKTIGSLMETSVLYIMKDGNEWTCKGVLSAFNDVFGIGKNISQDLKNNDGASWFTKSLNRVMYDLANPKNAKEKLLNLVRIEGKVGYYTITDAGKRKSSKEKPDIFSESFVELYSGPTKINLQEDDGKNGNAVGEADGSPGNYRVDNYIVSGIPGSGKSHFVQNVVLKAFQIESEEYVVRTVFHPEYTNMDFIGQIIPNYGVEDGSSSGNGVHNPYIFVPGPFTRALKLALQVKKESKNVVLIIEELNRGDGAAIFGEVFQLLDRNDDGESAYSIYSYYISRYLNLSADGEIRIPNNLAIVATMNTSDQNVFTMDTAFFRRWKTIRVPDRWSECKHSGWYVPGTKVSWKSFVNAVNSLISQYTSDIMNSEDKQLGPFFVSKEYLYPPDGKVPAEDSLGFGPKDWFATKVLGYLWNDVFSNHRECIFSDPGPTDHMILCFKNKGVRVFSDSFNKILDEENGD